VDYPVVISMADWNAEGVRLANYNRLMIHGGRTRISRRDFCTLSGASAASLVLSSACRHAEGSNSSKDGRITARPRTTNKPTVAGRINLGLDKDRDAILKTPKSDLPVPLLLFLHGATQSADDMFEYLGSAPEEAGVAILAPNSRDVTWDAITGSFGPDIQFLNRALERVFETVLIDTSRLAIGGFSDGASYALSVGLINGDLFKRIVANSPGFIIDGRTNGKPRFFISHGTRDQILPIDRCGRKVAADLRVLGYDVTFREFDGRHGIPPDVAREGMRWVAAKS
jgi:phospholipase/carboxylesterase